MYAQVKCLLHKHMAYRLCNILLSYYTDLLSTSKQTVLAGDYAVSNIKRGTAQ